MKLFVKLWLLSSILLLITSCAKTNNKLAPAPQNHLVKVAGERENLSLFCEAIEKTGLTAKLSSGNYTVFAPTNTAIQAYLDQLEVENIDGWLNSFGKDMVRNILLYHVVRGADIQAQQITSLFVKTEALNYNGFRLSLYTSRRDTLVKLNGEDCLSEMNIEADNGIIHSINTLMPLPSLVNLLQAQPSFSSYLEALERAPGNLTTMLRQENSNLSLFVPNNSAFVDFYSSNPNVKSLADLVHSYGSDNLHDRMKYHMLGKALRSEEITSKSYPTMLQGYSLQLKKDSHGNIGISDMAGNNAFVVIADITAINGVIHSINNLLSQQ